MTTNKPNKVRTLSRLLMGLLLVAAVSCSDHFDSLNTPDNRLAAELLDASTAGNAFAQSQYRGMWGSTGGPFQLGHSLFPDIYAQYFQTTHESFDSDRFIEVGRWINGAYVDLYANSAPQIFFLENFTEENNEDLANAMVKVWK